MLYVVKKNNTFLFVNKASLTVVGNYSKLVTLLRLSLTLLPAEALDKVDCWDPSSMGVPSGPVVTTDVTEPPDAVVTCVLIPPWAVVVIPLSNISDPICV